MGHIATPATRRPSRLRTWLTLLWFASSFGALYFARELSSLALFGWPLSYWLAGQGCVLVFLGIAAGYAATQNRLEPDADDAAEPVDG